MAGTSTYILIKCKGLFADRLKLTESMISEMPLIDRRIRKMTPKLENAIAAVKTLSPIERIQLLQILTEEATISKEETPLSAFGGKFWQGDTIEEITARQSPKTFSEQNNLAADFWPEEESVEDFLQFLKQQRQEATETITHESYSD